MRYLLYFLSAMFVSAVLFPFVIRIAKRLNVISPQDYRRKNETPLLGGLVIYFTAILFAVVFQWEDVRVILLYSFPLVAVSLLDDVIEVSSKVRALIQLLCVAGWTLFSLGQESIFHQLGFPIYLTLPLTLFWVVGMINALNMIDGQDLEAGSFTFFSSLVLAVLFWGQPESYFLFALAGATAGFLYFNKPPAKIYMGDCGSMFLGFTLACLSLKIPLGENPSISYLLVPLMLFAFPEIDATLAILRRLKTSNSIMNADRDHIHHKLLKIGFSVKHSALIIAGIILYSSVTTLAIYFFHDPLHLLATSFLAISGMLAVLGALFYIENKLASQVSNMSQSLIFKYLKNQGRGAKRVNPQKFSLVVYDLLPYYKEIQFRGISEVNNFVREFSEFVKEYHPESSYHFFGSYTVITVSERKYATKLTKNVLIKAYYDFLSHHEVMKSQSPIPWGMSFYTDKSKDENVLKKFGIKADKYGILELDKSA